MSTHRADMLGETGRLIIRNWRDEDGDLLHEICSDPRVIGFFPRALSRAESDAILSDVRDDIATTGLGFPVLELKATGRPIGFCGLKLADVGNALPDNTVEIGWRLAHGHWGKGYVTEAAEAMLAYGFETLGLVEVVSFAVPENTRSTAVMERLGMVRDPSRDFDHPKVPADKPHLIRHVLYALGKDAWALNRSARPRA